MKHLLGLEGRRNLRAVFNRHTLLAFDFDGTLAPIVARPQDAMVPETSAEFLRQLAALCPVAIITGRSVADLMKRLSFSPQFVIGNHGAEIGPAGLASAHGAALAEVRARLSRNADELNAVGIVVEDKGLSVALHYRLAASHQEALRCIEVLLFGLDASVRSFGGKCVVNIVPAAAPDKADALQRLITESGAPSVIFVGDDVNDEPVYERAASHWLTVRVGQDDPSTRARFYLEDQPEVELLLKLLLESLTNPQAHPFG